MSTIKELLTSYANVYFNDYDAEVLSEIVSNIYDVYMSEIAPDYPWLYPPFGDVYVLVNTPNYGEFAIWFNPDFAHKTATHQYALKNMLPFERRMPILGTVLTRPIYLTPKHLLDDSVFDKNNFHDFVKQINKFDLWNYNHGKCPSPRLSDGYNYDINNFVAMSLHKPLNEGIKKSISIWLENA